MYLVKNHLLQKSQKKFHWKKRFFFNRKKTSFFGFALEQYHPQDQNDNVKPIHISSMVMEEAVLNLFHLSCPKISGPHLQVWLLNILFLMIKPPFRHIWCTCVSIWTRLRHIGLSRWKNTNAMVDFISDGLI